MKNLYGILIIGAVMISFSSCFNSELSNPMNVVQFTELKADNYIIPQGDSTIVTAFVENICGQTSFDWNVSDGKIHGTKDHMIFVGSAAGNITITCTVDHPGKVSVTKNISISVE